MLAIPNPQPTPPPLPLLEDLASFLIGAAYVGIVLVLVLLVLWGTGVLRRIGMSAQQSLTVIGGLTVVVVVVGALGAFFRG